MARLLIADDDMPIRTSLRDFLAERLGHEVREAQDTEHALRSFREEPPDLAIVDLRLPALGGADLVERMRDERPELPIVLITASGFAAIPDRLHDARPAIHVIPKPILDLKEIGAVVDHLLAKSAEDAR